LPIFKKFRKSLSEFIERLVVSAAELGLLYTTDLIATIQTWITCMSSSQLRSFRHTATVVALEILTALCDVAAAVEKEADVLDRQRAAEKKRKAGNKTKTTTGREKELEGKATEVRERKASLAEFLKELVDRYVAAHVDCTSHPSKFLPSVFVNRYRDLDPAIRAECVHSIGLWFKKYPGHFLDGTYLRYVGWVLSDANTLVRLEAVKSLSGVYENSDYIASLQTFTERFKPRLVEMAMRDTELAVRVAVINVLGAIDGHQLLEDEQREELCMLVFDEDAKVRKAVSEFVMGVWSELVEEQLAGGKVGKQERTRAGIKALGKLLVRLAKPVGKKAAVAEDDEESLNGVASSPALRRVREVAALVGAEQRGRIALAVEALWNDVEPVSDWETLLDVLLLDHSTETEAIQESRGRRSKSNKASTDSAGGEVWRLEEVEEAVLLEVFVGSLRKAKVHAASAKKARAPTVVSPER
jgi:cohesin complex subunit SA-1/2